MNVNSLSMSNWGDLLHSKSYLGILKDEIKEFKSEKELAESGYIPLTIQKITEISKDKLKKVGTKDYFPASKISASIKKLTEQKEGELNSLSNRIIHAVGKIFNYLGINVGKNFFDQFFKWEQETQEDIKVGRVFCKIEVDQKDIQKIHSIAKETLNAAQTTDMKEKSKIALTGLLEDGLKSKDNVSLAFKKDHERKGISFEMQDGKHKVSHRSKNETSNEDNLTKAVQTVESFIEHFNEEEKRIWRPIIQSACTQTVGNAALIFTKSEFINGASPFYNENQYFLEQQEIPIHITVLRNTKNEIQGIKVSSDMSLNLFHIIDVSDQEKNYKTVETMSEFKVKISFHVTRNKKGNLDISKFKLNHRKIS